MHCDAEARRPHRIKLGHVTDKRACSLSTALSRRSQTNCVSSSTTFAADLAASACCRGMYVKATGGHHASCTAPRINACWRQGVGWGGVGWLGWGGAGWGSLPVSGRSHVLQHAVVIVRRRLTSVVLRPVNCAKVNI